MTEEQIEEQRSKIVGAYWFFTENHTGQFSDMYIKACRLSNIYKPGPLMTSYDDLYGPYSNPASLDHYATISKRYGLPCWFIDLSDDGTLDTVFSYFCNTCEETGEWRFSEVERWVDSGEITPNGIKDSIETILEDMSLGCKCSNKQRKTS